MTGELSRDEVAPADDRHRVDAEIVRGNEGITPIVSQLREGLAVAAVCGDSFPPRTSNGFGRGAHHRIGLERLLDENVGPDTSRAPAAGVRSNHCAAGDDASIVVA